MHVAAAEGAEAILQRQSVSLDRHPVVDRHSAVKREVPHDPPRTREETPLPNLIDGSYSGHNNGLAEVVFRIPMVALTKEKRVTGAVGDVRDANAAANPEDAVPR